MGTAKRWSKPGWVVAGSAILAIVVWGFADGWALDVPRWAREWLTQAEPLAPFSTALVAAVAGIVAWRSYRHRRFNDTRAEWWRRTQYGVELAVEDDAHKRAIGMRVLLAQAGEQGIFQRDRDLLQSLNDELRDEAMRRSAAVPAAPDTEDPAVDPRRGVAARHAGRGICGFFLRMAGRLGRRHEEEAS
ncbi:hypothetical protein [Brevibacterium yomogidense]|uniref:hypothetical protein n=1 Tax=Brevibacterium yomogidense TaxID=946573 RepID=UPI0018DF2816|nr:hypothetical protein [Brevibacterium yomogidense]